MNKKMKNRSQKSWKVNRRRQLLKKLMKKLLRNCKRRKSSKKSKHRKMTEINDVDLQQLLTMKNQMSPRMKQRKKRK